MDSSRLKSTSSYEPPPALSVTLSTHLSPADGDGIADERFRLVAALRRGWLSSRRFHVADNQRATLDHDVTGDALAERHARRARNLSTRADRSPDSQLVRGFIKK